MSKLNKNEFKELNKQFVQLLKTNNCNCRPMIPVLSAIPSLFNGEYRLYYNGWTGLCFENDNHQIVIERGYLENSGYYMKIMNETLSMKINSLYDVVLYLGIWYGDCDDLRDALDMREDLSYRVDYDSFVSIWPKEQLNSDNKLSIFTSYRFRNGKLEKCYVPAINYNGLADISIVPDYSKTFCSVEEVVGAVSLVEL
jgi:hypothetical protein